jgi:hypothetical protein
VAQYYLDTEFNGFGGRIISLALVSACGQKSIYLVTSCENPVPWVEQNVMPHLYSVPFEPAQLGVKYWGYAIAEFLRPDSDPVIIADWPDDIRYLCELLIVAPGVMVDIPQLTFKIARVDAYPTVMKYAVQHNAWWDALALRFKMLSL